MKVINIMPNKKRRRKMKKVESEHKKVGRKKVHRKHKKAMSKSRKGMLTTKILPPAILPMEIIKKLK